MKDKDGAGFVLYLIWRDYVIDYIDLSTALIQELEGVGNIPKEDLGIYLTALFGEANCFVSANRELVKQVAVKQQIFECLTAAEFSEKYIQGQANKEER